MQTLTDYFSYNNDYTEVGKVFYNLSKKMKEAHNNGMAILYFSSNNIIYDNGFKFAYQDNFNNYNVEKRENSLSFAKLMLGTYLSLSTGFKDFSNVSTEWFQLNLNDICSSVNQGNDFYNYFNNVFNLGSDEYYCDYLDKKMQERRLDGASNTNSYRKVLSNAASAFYEQSDEEENSDLFDYNNKTALINKLFYPSLLFCSLIIIVSILYLFIN